MLEGQVPTVAKDMHVALAILHLIQSAEVVDAFAVSGLVMYL